MSRAMALVKPTFTCPNCNALYLIVKGTADPESS
jgi:hypothetical protein